MKAREVERATPDARTQWSDVFHVSRLTPVVFNVDERHQRKVGELLKTYDLATVSSSSLFSSAYRSTALLDGMVIQLSTYGFPAGALRSGIRVVGVKPMRLLCQLLELKPPARRLKGEVAIADPKVLLTEFEDQRKKPRDQLEHESRLGLGISDRVGLLLLVKQLYGDAYMPPADDAMKRAMHGPGAWGEEGFSQYDAEQLQAEGVPLDEAGAWRQLGCDVQETIRCRRYGLENLRPWLKAGFPTWHATRRIDEGRSIDDMKPFLVIGCHPSWIESFIEGGLGPEDFRAFEALGFDGHKASLYARFGFRAAEAKRWSDAGIPPYPAGMMFRRGHSLDDALKLRSRGWSTQDLERYFWTTKAKDDPLTLPTGPPSRS